MNWIKRHPITSIWVGGFLVLICYGIAKTALEEIEFSETILAAGREAPLGGEYIYLFSNGDVDYGTFLLWRKRAIRSQYSLKGDTVVLDTGKIRERFPRGFYVIDGDHLETGQITYNVLKNELKKKDDESR